MGIRVCRRLSGCARRRNIAGHRLEREREVASRLEPRLARLLEAPGHDARQSRRNIGRQRRARQFDPTVGVQRYEMALESTYRLRFLGDAFFFQPDLQYIIRPGGTSQHANAVVIGFQSGFNF